MSDRMTELEHETERQREKIEQLESELERRSANEIPRYLSASEVPRYLWLLAVLTVLGVVWLVKAPESVVTRFELVAKVLTPLVIVVGLSIALYRARIADKQSATAAERTAIADKQAETVAKQAETAASGQLTERFSRAVEQLGKESLAVRLGGIYALERIAQDSDRDHWTVMEVLCSYVRYPPEVKEGAEGAEPTDGDEGAEPTDGDEAEAANVPPDIQAILTVLGRRHTDKETKGQRLDLIGACLLGANLRGNLSGADLRGADLRGADLMRANLSDAVLRGADLRDADLRGADLRGADLDGADLSGAKLSGVYLTRAKLRRADLSDANLFGARLSGANLFEANLSGATVIGANLSDALLDGADLSGAKGLTQAKIDSARGDQETQLPGGLKRPDYWDGEPDDQEQPLGQEQPDGQETEW